MQDNRHVPRASSGRNDLRNNHRENQLGRKPAAERPSVGRVPGQPVRRIVPLPGAVRHRRGDRLGGGDGIPADARGRPHQDRRHPAAVHLPGIGRDGRYLLQDQPSCN